MEPKNYTTASKQGHTTGSAPLQHILDAARIGTWQSFSQNRQILPDARCREWLNIDAAHPLDLSDFVEYLHPADRSLFLTGWQQGLQSGLLDLTVRSGSRQRLLRFQGSLLLDGDGSPAGLGGAVQEVEEPAAIVRKDASFEGIFEKLPVAVGILSREGLVFEMVNPLYCEIIGRSREELLGKPMLEAVPEAAGQGFDRLMKDVMETGKPFSAQEMPVSLMRGGKLEEVFIHLSFEPYHDADGQVSGVLVVGTEVTEQVQIRKAVEESEARLELLSNAVPAMIFYLNAEQRYQSYNDRFRQWFGVSGDEALGRTVREFVGEAAYARVLPHLEKAYGGETVSFEMPAPARMGLGKWLGIVYAPHLAADGSVQGVIVHASDITASKKVELELRETGERFRALINKAPMAIALFTGRQHHYIEIANEAMLVTWGKDASVIGKPLVEGVPEMAGQPFPNILDNIYETKMPFIGKGMPAQLSVNGKLGTYYFDFTYQPIFDAAGEVTGVLDMALDVTDQILFRNQVDNLVIERTQELATANQSLLESNNELQRSNRNLEEFAHAASHDLKEPIRKIQFFTERLRAQLQEKISDEQLSTFSRITNATQRMGMLVDDLLVYSHFSQRPQEKDTVDLNVKLKRVLEDLELDIQQRSARVDVGPLPQVRGYRRQLQQLFQNLITNAIKYSKEDEAPQIVIRSERVEKEGLSYHLIEVRDNGIGFDQQYAEKIFQIFARLHGKGEYSGSGVGLSIVRKIVENHEGLIEVESEKGLGSTFRVYLPTE